MEVALPRRARGSHIALLGQGAVMHPSGRQVEIRHGEQRAVVVEVGGGVRCYDVAGTAVIDGYDADEMVTGARGQPLIPWPNRLHGGTYTWDGEEHVVPLDEPEQGNALHGLTRWRNWQVGDVGADAVTMRHRLHPQPAYPFALDLAVIYRLDDGGLTVTTTATNIGTRDAPYGTGAHPYVTVGTARIDTALLQIPAATWLPTDPSQIPTGREPVEGTPYDFRTPHAIGDVAVDYAFTDLVRGDDGRATVVLASPDDSRRVEVWVDQHYPYVEIFTGDTLPTEHRRREGMGVEPMTCPPDAFRTGDDLIRLAPGQSVTTTWGIRSS
jgi:aldose 1-epimerase